MERKKNVSKAQKPLQGILKEGELIYPISEESDKSCDETNHVENWADIFYHIKRPKMKERFKKLITISEYSKFFEALNYEYGLNGVKIDLKKAFDIYKKASDTSTDSLSMYRMYHIYKKDFGKFKIAKRNRVYELFYIFKSFSYINGRELNHSGYLFNRFDVLKEVAMIFSIEDNIFSKFQSFIHYLKKYHKQLNINLNTILLIDAVINVKFRMEVENEKDILLFFEPDLLKVDLEANYKVACFLSDLKIKEAEKYFQLLYNKKYYRSLSDYALYVFYNKKDSSKALSLLKEAYNKGFISGGILYYDVFINSLSHTKFELFLSDTSKKSNLKEIFEMLIDCLSIYEETYFFFEYYFLRKICIKHYGLKNYLDSLFLEYTKEIVSFILEITDEENGSKKELVKKYFVRVGDYYPEFNLVSGIYYYYGIEDLIEKNLEKSLVRFKTSYKESKDSLSYSRFLYSYIYAVRKKLYDIDNNSIPLEKIEKTKKKLFGLFKKSIESEDIFPYLSSSFFYYLSRLYKNKIGNDGNLMMEYICLKRACDRINDTPGSGSILSYYRKFKSNIKIKKEEKERYKGILDGIKGYNDSEGYGDDNSFCPICFERKRNIICLPCKHLFCLKCSDHFQKRQCPICRSLIIHTYNVETNK